MKKQRVLYVSQEITPYLPESEMSVIGRFLPQGIQERGREIRTFMPKYGSINERRNQLHEVIRLSGMNLIIKDADHPLIIKVASIQAARMQVYFIDNEDFFDRKAVLVDSKGVEFDDNDERAIFFARGVLETVKKLRWAPNMVHCHGWFTSVVPLYLKRAFIEDPLFSDTKVIYSIYGDSFKKTLSSDFHNKIMMEGINKEDIDVIKNPDFIQLNKMAIDHSDGIIIASQDINQEVLDYAKDSGIPVLDFQGQEEYVQAYSDFYDQVSGS
jgi:starch synthase